MQITKEEREVLHILVKKELDQITKEGDALLVSNVSFISKITAQDLPFLKSLEKYKHFLQDLSKSLR
jgi:hypothetical protein